MRTPVRKPLATFLTSAACCAVGWSLAGQSGSVSPAFAVRQANAPLLQQAQNHLDKVRQATQRLEERAAALELVKTLPDAQRDQLKADIIAAHRELRGVDRIGEQLLIRGEIDGRRMQLNAGPAADGLASAVQKLRLRVGSEQSHAAFAARQVTKNLTALRQIDSLIASKQWSEAQKRLLELRDESDAVAVFVDRAAATPLYEPIRERLEQLAVAGLEQEKQAAAKDLRAEFAAFTKAHLDFRGLAQQMDEAAKAVASKQSPRWEAVPVSPPEFLDKFASHWRQVERDTVRAAAALHALGSLATTDLRVFASDYQAARTQALLLPRSLVAAELSHLTGSEIESRYAAYLRVIPKYMSALRATPTDFQNLEPLLRQLIDRSPELAARVQSYRTATDEALRWRRRLARRYLKLAHDRYAQALPLKATADATGSGATLSGSVAPSRFNQSVLPWHQLPESLSQPWRDAWRGVSVVATLPYVSRAGDEGSTVTSQWHGRVAAEISLAGSLSQELLQAIAQDLLCAAPESRPLTFEAALALHTLSHGPYNEVGAVVQDAAVDSLPDRFWDQAEPGDTPLATDSAALVGPPNFPVVVTLRASPIWVAHDLLVTVLPAPATSASPATPTPAPAEAPAAAAAQPSVPAKSPTPPTKGKTAPAKGADTPKKKPLPKGAVEL